MAGGSVTERERATKWLVVALYYDWVVGDGTMAHHAIQFALRHGRSVVADNGGINDIAPTCGTNQWWTR